MRVLVTGANGMLGQDLCPILEDEGYDVIETDIHIMDITEELVVLRVLTEEEPNLVIHCAAYTNVDKAEEEFEKAELINAKGTENLAKVCAKFDIPIIYISTDYVFDGNKGQSYITDDKPNPVNNYGLTKLHGEEVIQKYCKKYYIVRTSWLYGHYGKNFVETMLNLAKTQEKIKVVDDQIGSPTWTADLSLEIVKILNEPYGIYHISGKGETSWYEFAKEIFKLTNLNVDLEACSSSEFIRPAKRPKYSVLSGNNCRNWKSALKEYLLLRDEEEV